MILPAETPTRTCICGATIYPVWDYKGDVETECTTPDLCDECNDRSEEMIENADSQQEVVVIEDLFGMPHGVGR